MSNAHDDQYDAAPGGSPTTEQAPVEPDEGSGDHYDPHYLGGSRKKKRGFSGCLAVIVALAVILGGAYFVGNKGYHYLKDHLSSAEDYPGPGHGQVLFQVTSGDTVTQIGRELKAQGVVASVQAFMDASHGKTGIQVGYYQLKKKMAAKDAFDVLINPQHILTTKVTVPEGLRVSDTVAVLAARTKYSMAQFDAALKDTAALGLPSYANGDPEGYLFPSTYGFGPKEKPADMLKDMVTRWNQAAGDNDLVAGAQALGYTPAEVMTMASLVQAEGRGKYMVKISRTLYNRLENPDNGITNGLLQVDASVNYALHRSGTTAISDADKASVENSPYNTYSHTGLPPTPIEAPGDDAIQAALHPADGNWLFYVTVNLKTGETKFTDDYDTFLGFKDELQEYCETQSDRC
jgi:UPF0755 protein